MFHCSMVNKARFINCMLPAFFLLEFLDAKKKKGKEGLPYISRDNQGPWQSSSIGYPDTKNTIYKPGNNNHASFVLFLFLIPHLRTAS